MTNSSRVLRTVLVAEDDDLVRELVTAHLERSGYGVTAVASGPAALEILQCATEPFSVLFTDFSMPGMDGVELIERARKLCPQLRCILHTSADVDQGILPPGTVVLAKTTSRAKIAQTLAAVIENDGVAG